MIGNSTHWRRNMGVLKQLSCILLIIATACVIYAFVTVIPHIPGGAKNIIGLKAITDELEEAGYCDAKDDCVRVPVDCEPWSSWAVNRAEAERIAEFIHQYEERCVPTDGLYPSSKHDCINNTCRSIYLIELERSSTTA